MSKLKPNPWLQRLLDYSEEYRKLKALKAEQENQPTQVKEDTETK